jgi:hypothetical protein
MKHGETMEYMTGKDCPHLCNDCRVAIDDIAAMYNEGEMSDDDDEEAPCMYVYDHGMYCGGHECIKPITA